MEPEQKTKIMQRYTATYFFNWLVYGIWVVAATTFSLGLATIHHRNIVDDVFKSWFYWRFALTPVMGAVAIVAYSLYMSQISYSRLARGSLVLFLLMLLFAWFVVHGFIEVSALARYQKELAPGEPLELFAANRDSDKTNPDPGFLLCFAGIILYGFSTFMAMSMVFRVGNIVNSVTVARGEFYD